MTHNNFGFGKRHRRTALKRGAVHWLTGVTVVAAFVTAAVSCGSNAIDDQSQEGSVDAVAVEASAAPTTTSPVSDSSDSGAVDEPSGENGEAVAVDDVGDASQAPMTSGSLLVVSSENAPALWEAVDFTPDPSQLPYVGGLLSVELVDSVSEAVVPIVDGGFAVEGFMGNHFVCLVTGDGPYVLNGCSEVNLVDGARWRVTRGEGGFEFLPAEG